MKLPGLVDRLIEVKLTAKYLDDDGTLMVMEVDIPQAKEFLTHLGYAKPDDGLEFPVGIDPKTMTIRDEVIPDSVIFSMKLVRNSEQPTYMMIKHLPADLIDASETDIEPSGD